MSDNMHAGWTTETRWRSDNGHGRYEARCVDEIGDVFVFERRDTRSKAKRPRWIAFEITAKALAARSCRWTRVSP